MDEAKPEPLSPEWMEHQDSFMRSWSAHQSLMLELSALALAYRVQKLGGDRFKADVNAAWQASGEAWERGLQMFQKLMAGK